MTNEDVMTELDEMSKSVAGNQLPKPKEEPKSKEDPKTKEVEKEEVKEPEKEPKAEPEVKEEKVEKPEKEETPIPEPKKEADDSAKTIVELRAKIAELETKKQEPKTPEKLEETKIEDLDFTTDLDLDEVSRSPEELNKLLNTVHKRAVSTTEKAIMDKLPELVTQRVEVVQMLQKVNDDFYNANPDLVSFKKVVATVWKELAEKNPDQKMIDTVKDVAPEVRKRLGLKAPEVKKETKKEEKPPTLPRKNSSGSRGESKSEDPGSLASQIAEMNKAL